ncbi:LysE family translocator [Uliginosibacterium paludis]|uniref:LysE family translocator n=1 Tax=Uliginosibacterium paludis TaxID=1615952 RepID=A0ABV2CNV3_9RHOO
MPREYVLGEIDPDDNNARDVPFDAVLMKPPSGGVRRGWGTEKPLSFVTQPRTTPMPLNTWLVFVAAVFVLTVTPGPSVLMAVSTSVNRGFRQAVLAALGSTSAVVCIMLLSAVGLGAILSTSELLFNLLKWAGAAYLAYLGIASLFSSGGNLTLTDEGGSIQAHSFVRGFLVGASNPKALIFFTALFPQFIDPARPQLPQLLLLCATFVAFELFWLTTYAALGSRAKRWLQHPGRAQLFNRATGGVFLLAAGVLASARRSAA